MSNPDRDPVAEKAAAQARQSEANASLERAKGDVRKTKAELDEASGETKIRGDVQKGIAEFKEFAAADLAQTKADFKHARERLKAWDAAATRDFEARLDAADAQIAVWSAEADVERADAKIQRHDDLATLKERIALARARSAAARHAEYTAAAQDALGDAAEAFDDAYEAAQSKYNR